MKIYLLFKQSFSLIETLCVVYQIDSVLVDYTLTVEQNIGDRIADVDVLSSQI